MQQILDAIPHLREGLSSKNPFSGERGALTTTRRLRRVVKGNVALIGDASGSVDAVTGEGLAIGFRQAALLGRSLEQDSLDLYAAEHEMTLRMARRMARALLAMDKHAALRRAAMHALANSPELFRGLLQVHMGEEELSHLLLHKGILADFDVSASEVERASL
jgi:flavin-dependent dehydrogenase